MAQLPDTFKAQDVTPRHSTQHRWLYTGVHWKRLSAFIRRRDPMCRICQERPSKAVDHIIALSDGGAAYDADNLQGLCHQCHRKKTREEIARRAGPVVSPGSVGCRSLGVAVHQ